jgi:hypothetical protein
LTGYPSRGPSIIGTVRVRDRAGVGALHGSIELVDASFQDVAAKVVASTKIMLPVDLSETSFQLSIPFEIDPKAHYLITGRLDGKDLETGHDRIFGTTVAYPWTLTTHDVLIELRPWK